MVTSVQVRPFPEHRVTKRFIVPEDRESPIRVCKSQINPHVTEENWIRLNSPFLFGRRVQLRFDPAVWGVHGGKWKHMRMCQEHLLVSCPNPQQARAVLDMVQQFILSLDGRWLDESK